MLKGIHKYLLICFGVVFVAPYSNAARIMNNNPIKEDWGCKVVDGDWQCARSEKPKNVFNPKLSQENEEKALADDMSWVPKQDYFVGGYYNNDESFTKALCRTDKTNLSYENAEYDTDGTLVASGNVEVLQCNQELYSDNSIVNFSPDGSSIQSMVMTGDVVAKQPSTGILLRTEELDVNLTDGTYSAGKSFFRLAHESPPTRMYDKEHFSGHLRGYGDTFKKNADGNIFLEDGYITSGDPYDNDWKMTGNNIDIDTEEGMAYITDGYLKVKDVPVMYFPYFSQPIDDRRRSGFLYPGFNQVGDTEITRPGGIKEKRQGGGTGISIPYYFNLGKNYDLLTQTVIWSNRGLMENGTFRYKTNYFEGQIEGSAMLDTLEQKLRGAFTISNQGDFNNGIKTNFQYDYVSDRNYYNDFSVGDIGLVTKTLLDREFDVTYQNENIDAGLTLLSYGLVNEDMNLGNIPYAKLPELTFSANSTGYTPDYLDLSIDTVNTYFTKAPHPIEPLTSATVGTNVNAFRAYESPKVQVNYENLWGYINPSLEVPIRYYQLQSRPTDTIKFQKNSVSSVLPIFNIDSAVNFDRDYTTGEGAYTQTLTPRLFYTYIPYQDQSDIPLFDTTQQNEQYMQMFEVNRFTGHDRINNANQITYAMESTTMSNDDGTTLSSFKIGQQFFMADRLVTLQQGDSKSPTTPGSTDTFSPVMSSFEYQILKSVYLQGQVNYSVQGKKFDYQVYGIQYKDENENIFNIAYNNIANNYNSLTQDQINNGQAPVAQETLTVSTLLNVTDHWGIASLWNYNFKQKQVANAFVALQYNDKSWAVRALAQASSFTNQNPNDPLELTNLTYSYMLEFELKGLGGVGDTAQISSQLHQITGYETGEWGEGI